MPIINKPKRSCRYKYKKHDKQGEIQKLYNSAKWVKLRLSYLQKNPLCENCERNGRITLATAVHHKRIISSVEDILEMMDLTYDQNNLMSVCNECHNKMHTYARKRNIKYIDFIKLNEENK